MVIIMCANGCHGDVTPPTSYKLRPMSTVGSSGKPCYPPSPCSVGRARSYAPVTKPAGGKKAREKTQNHIK